MNYGQGRCSNMNHSKSNCPIRFCPNCGERTSTSAKGGACNETKHAARRKDRDLFCIDCGKKLGV